MRQSEHFLVLCVYRPPNAYFLFFHYYNETGFHIFLHFTVHRELNKKGNTCIT